MKLHNNLCFQKMKFNLESFTRDLWGSNCLYRRISRPYCRCCWSMKFRIPAFSDDPVCNWILPSVSSILHDTSKKWKCPFRVTQNISGNKTPNCDHLHIIKRNKWPQKVMAKKLAYFLTCYKFIPSNEFSEGHYRL